MDANTCTTALYYKLNDEEVAFIPSLPPDFTLIELNFLIRKEYCLSSISPRNIHIFAAGSNDANSPLPVDTIIPKTTSRTKPLLVRVNGTIEDSAVAPYSPKKKARTILSCRSISNAELQSPIDIIPPKATEPKFVGSDWLSNVEVEVIACLQRSDDIKWTDKNHHSIDRIPPMALVRCSRGGKTRALYEIANRMRGYNSVIHSEVACLYVSFNDNTSLRHWEQECPLQALLRRIAFHALPPEATAISTGTRFSNFSQDRPIWEEKLFLKWLGDTPCLLLLDDLNNWEKLTETNSAEASKFGDFIKSNFISRENRYFVFSSHTLATLPFFGNFIDPSIGSSRAITLEELPLVPTLEVASYLRKELDSTREAVYYGLVPGMIHEAGIKGENIGGKRYLAVRNFISKIKSPEEFQCAFFGILLSLLDGDWSNIPEELHILLDSTPSKEGVTHKIRWVPYHLQYVLAEMGSSIHDKINLAQRLSDLCNLIKDAKEESGEGWEGLFVLVLIVRCLNNAYDGTFVPAEWFDSSPKIFFNGPYDGLKNNLPIGKCKTWDELRKGMVHGKTPQLSIWHPTHNRFEVYDALVVYSNGEKPLCIYGYQFKQGKAARRHRVHSDVTSSIFVQGNPPAKTIDQDAQGWTIPNNCDIDRFFGESGKHWTPESWKNFKKDAC